MQSDQFSDVGTFTVSGIIVDNLGGGEAAAGAGPRLRVAEAAAQELSPPDGNTGVGFPEPQGKGAGGPPRSIRVDWLNGTFPLGNLGKVRALLVSWLGAMFPREVGVYGFTYCELTSTGGFLAWSDPGKGDLGMVSLPGECMSLLDAEGQIAILQAMFALGLKLTRIDVAYDDYEKLVTPAEVHGAFKRGDCSGFGISTFHEKQRRRGRSGSPGGETCELGRRGKMGSGKQLVVYDKAAESKGKFDCIRWEARYFKDRAAEIGLVIRQSCFDGAELAALLAKLMPCCEFLDRSGTDEKNLERLEPLPWWKALKERWGGKLEIVAKQPATNLERLILTIRTQYAPGIATIAAAFAELGGGDIYEFLGEVIDDGEKRRKKKHRIMQAEYVQVQEAAAIPI